jgi:hypothetical protein
MPEHVAASVKSRGLTYPLLSDPKALLDALRRFAS